MSFVPIRPFVEVLREALRTLENEPGLRTPEKLDLIQHIRRRITEEEAKTQDRCSI